LPRLVTQFQEYLNRRLWAEEASGAGGLWREFWRELLQILVLAGWALIHNRSWLWAASLAYATILALIPLLALLFAILKSLGIQRLLAAHLMDRLAPGAHDFALQIFAYIEGTRVTSLGVFGVIWLVAALLILMTEIEQAFNAFWQVPQTRTLRRKLSDYLSIFLLFPILMAVAISLSSGLLSQPHLRNFFSGLLPGFFYSATTNLLSLGLLWVAFTFIYLVMPNTRVQFTSALLGGIIGGSLWQLAHMIFAWFQGAATYYNAIYGALYHLLFLVIWMFWSWLVVLFGTAVAYAHQNLASLRRLYLCPSSDREPVDEFLALAALVAICTRFVKCQPLLSQEELAVLFSKDDFLALRIIRALKDCQLVLETMPAAGNQPPKLVPAMPLDRITVREVLECLRAARATALVQTIAAEPQLDALLQRLAKHTAPSPWDSLTLAELVKLAGTSPQTADREPT
jgi:membrane protein